MIENAGGLRLAREALLKFFRLFVVGMRAGANRLQRDEAPDDRILGEIDDTHRALAKLTNHFIATELQETFFSGVVAADSLSRRVCTHGPFIINERTAGPARILNYDVRPVLKSLTESDS